MVTEISLTCRLCENTFLKPKVLPCCNITCCYQCLKSLENDNKGCPSCGTSFYVDKLPGSGVIEYIINKIKPSLLTSQALDDYAKYPHLQTAVVKRAMRDNLMRSVEMDESISFYIRYRPTVCLQPVIPSSKPSTSSPPSIEPQIQNMGISAFTRGYRCLASTPISTIRQMMVQKFQIDESVARVMFYNSGAELADRITLRTVAFRMNSSETKRMTLEMLIMSINKPQQPSTSSSIEGVITEEAEKDKMKNEEAENAAEKLEEGPPVLEEETMPSLDAETPQLGQEPTPPPSIVDESKTESPTITTVIPMINSPPKHNNPVIGQMIPMQYQPQMHRTPPNMVQIPSSMHRTPPNMVQLPASMHRTPPNMVQQSTSRPVSVDKSKPPVSKPFNQQAINQAVEFLFLRAVDHGTEPNKFLDYYYVASNGPPLHRKLTPEEERMFAFRRQCDVQGAFIPSISPEMQTTLYHQMLEKRKRMLEEERAKKRRSIDTPQDGMKRLKKTEVSAYVVSTPIMHKMPPPPSQLPSTSSSPSSSSSSMSSLPGPSVDEKTIVMKQKQELPISMAKTDKPSPLTTPIQQLDALTLSRQCSKTLGKTLAESMRRSGGNSSAHSTPSFMLHQKPAENVTSSINSTKFVPVDEKQRIGPV